jgi:hypothetical protein
VLCNGEHGFRAIVLDTRIGVEVRYVLVRETDEDTKNRACCPGHQGGALGDDQIKPLDPGSTDVGWLDALLLEQHHIHKKAVEKDIDASRSHVHGLSSLPSMTLMI